MQVHDLKEKINADSSTYSSAKNKSTPVGFSYLLLTVQGCRISVFAVQGQLF